MLLRSLDTRPTLQRGRFTVGDLDGRLPFTALAAGRASDHHHVVSDRLVVLISTTTRGTPHLLVEVHDCPPHGGSRTDCAIDFPSGTLAVRALDGTDTGTIALPDDGYWNMSIARFDPRDLVDERWSVCLWPRDESAEPVA